MKFCLVFFVLIQLFPSKVEAALNRDSFPRWSVMLLPSAMLHRQIPAAQIGVQYRFSPIFQLNQEVGLITFKYGLFDDKIGLRFRTEPRVYIDEEIFLGLQFRYWFFNSKETGDFRRFGGVYNERIDYERRQVGIGGNFSFGFRFEELDKLIYTEIAFAVGFHHITNQISSIPDDAESLNRWGGLGFFFSNPRNPNVYPLGNLVLQIDVRIGLGFGNRR